jgi:hypothetical protein
MVDKCTFSLFIHEVSSFAPPLSNSISVCLSVCQAWADAFRSSPSLGGVVCVYEDLRRRGLEFPMTDLDALSPIHTPLRVRLKEML